MGPFWDKCINWPKNDLDVFQGQIKVRYAHPIYIPEGQMFLRFALRSAVFELRVNFGTTCSTQNDPKWPDISKVKSTPSLSHIHHRGPNFRAFRSTVSPFEEIEILTFPLPCKYLHFQYLWSKRQQFHNPKKVLIVYHHQELVKMIGCENIIAVVEGAPTCNLPKKKTFSHVKESEKVV